VAAENTADRLFLVSLFSGVVVDNLPASEDLQPILPSWVRFFKPLAVLGLLLATLVLFGGLFIIERQTLEVAAVREARNYVRAIESLRTLYTASVVEPLTEQGIEASHIYREKEGTIPLPATLSMELGADIAEQSGEGFSFRLFSQYPFPWRKGGGPRDAFEREALKALAQNPDKPFYRVEIYNGSRILRYAEADLMRAECIHCHNNHPQTPKAGWQEGDMRGVLEASVPLYGVEGERERALQIAYLALLFFVLVMFTVLMMIGRLIDKTLKPQ
jgi:Protein of unknown function (DUF3365)